MDLIVIVACVLIGALISTSPLFSKRTDKIVLAAKKAALETSDKSDA